MEKKDTQMKSQYTHITEILKLFEASDFTALALEFEGVRLNVSKGGIEPDTKLLVDESGSVESVPHKPAFESAQRGVPAEPAPPSRQAPAAAPKAEALEPGLHVIRAPMLGTFYRSRSPGEPPFVAEGAPVDAADTLCLIECMKLFNTIHAGVKGRLVRFCVENGSLIEFDQPIAYISLD